MIVYKYLPPNLVSVLVNSTLRFTQAVALNDPFESSPLGTHLNKSLVDGQREWVKQSGIEVTGMGKVEVEAYIIQRAREVVQSVTEPVRRNFGILSVSLERSELLMWSHYCDSHRGFVIGFEGLHEYFQKGIPDKRGGLREVIYSEKRPHLPPFDRFSEYNVAEILLLTKSLHWSYEKELRMLHNIEHADINLGPDQGGHNIYLFKFPPETVKEIILGCQISEDKRQELFTVAREKYPEAKIFQAVMNKTEFKLDLEEVETKALAESSASN
jgi:hypothetical protein